LNERADKPATRGVKGTANFPGEIVETLAQEIESEEEFVMNDNDVTREEDWDEFEDISPGTVRERSLGLAEEEERENQEEVLKRFAHDFLGESSDSPKDSTSQDGSDLLPELGDDSSLQVFAGNGSRVTREDGAPIPAGWPRSIAVAFQGTFITPEFNGMVGKEKQYAHIRHLISVGLKDAASHLRISSMGSGGGNRPNSI
jgi:hypothetical protein